MKAVVIAFMTRFDLYGTFISFYTNDFLLRYAQEWEITFGPVLTAVFDKH